MGHYIGSEDLLDQFVPQVIPETLDVESDDLLVPPAHRHLLKVCLRGGL
jgi:hypothetical protein